MNETPWYHSGLRFQCTQCGNCCSGAPGYVWVTEEEIQTLAVRLGRGAESLEDMYIRKVGARKSLREYQNGDCVFFDRQPRTCAVYEARPCQCRTWPFWDSNLRSPEDWKHTCDRCPGAGQGRLYRLEEIDSLRKVIRI